MVGSTVVINCIVTSGTATQIQWYNDERIIISYGNPTLLNIVGGTMHILLTYWSDSNSTGVHSMCSIRRLTYIDPSITFLYLANGQ
jgi:hypothetical protein